MERLVLHPASELDMAVKLQKAALPGWANSAAVKTCRCACQVKYLIENRIRPDCGSLFLPNMAKPFDDALV